MNIERFGITNINELWSEDSALFELQAILQNQTWRNSDRGQRWRNKVLALRDQVFYLAAEMERDFLEPGESNPEEEERLRWLEELLENLPPTPPDWQPPPPDEDEIRQQTIHDWLNLSDVEREAQEPPQAVLDLARTMQAERDQREMDEAAFKSSTLDGFSFSKPNGKKKKRK